MNFLKRIQLNKAIVFLMLTTISGAQSQTASSNDPKSFKVFPPPVGKITPKYVLYFDASDYTHFEESEIYVVLPGVCEEEGISACFKPNTLNYDDYLYQVEMGYLRRIPGETEDILGQKPFKVQRIYHFYRPILCNYSVDAYGKRIAPEIDRLIQVRNYYEQKGEPPYFINRLTLQSKNWFDENGEKAINEYNFFVNPSYTQTHDMVCLPLFEQSIEGDSLNYIALDYSLKNIFKQDDNRAVLLDTTYFLAPFILSAGVGGVVSTGFSLGMRFYNASKMAKQTEKLISAGIKTYEKVRKVEKVSEPSVELVGNIHLYTQTGLNIGTAGYAGYKAHQQTELFLLNSESYSPSALGHTERDSMNSADKFSSFYNDLSFSGNKTRWNSPEDQRVSAQYTDIDLFSGRKRNTLQGDFYLGEVIVSAEAPAKIRDQQAQTLQKHNLLKVVNRIVRWFKDKSIEATDVTPEGQKLKHLILSQRAFWNGTHFEIGID